LVDGIEEIVQSSDVVETVGTVQSFDFHEKQAFDWATDDLQSRELVEGFARRTVVHLCGFVRAVAVATLSYVHVQRTLTVVLLLSV
jgi:hypothetical protein